MQFYTDPERESSLTAQPDAEVFRVSQREFIQAAPDTWMAELLKSAMDGGFSNFQGASDLAGWFWWSCQPGCLPDGDAFGPFNTEADAIADARSDGA